MYKYKEFKSRLFNEKQLEFIVENYRGKTRKELTFLLNQEFNASFTENQIKSFMANHKLASGVDTRFKKGNSPMNKGKKWDEYMSKEGQKNSLKTCFKKGNEPHNTRPMGSERKGKDGYILVKVRKHRTNLPGKQNTFDSKHKVIWEDANGPIPNGYCLRFIDGNKENCVLENLELITLEENAFINHNRISFNNRHSGKATITLARLNVKANQIIRRRKENAKK